MAFLVFKNEILFGLVLVDGLIGWWLLNLVTLIRNGINENVCML